MSRWLIHRSAGALQGRVPGLSAMLPWPGRSLWRRCDGPWRPGVSRQRRWWHGAWWLNSAEAAPYITFEWLMLGLWSRASTATLQGISGQRRTKEVISKCGQTVLWSFPFCANGWASMGSARSSKEGERCNAQWAWEASNWVELNATELQEAASENERVASGVARPMASTLLQEKRPGASVPQQSGKSPSGQAGLPWSILWASQLCMTGISQRPGAHKKKSTELSAGRLQKLIPTRAGAGRRASPERDDWHLPGFPSNPGRKEAPWREALSISSSISILTVLASYHQASEREAEAGWGQRRPTPCGTWSTGAT